jgi:hypothetical protein
MSLLRAVIRATAVGALRDRTWCQGRVWDSDITPLAEAIYGQKDAHGNPVAQPYCVCYTDADDIGPVTGLGELYSGDNRSLSLVLEIGVASAIRDPSGVIKIQFSATDVGMEWACDVISAQAIAALVGDPHSPWGDLLKRLIVKIRRMPTRRGGMAQSGVRFAARKITLVLEPMWDIVPGRVLQPGHPVLDFIALATANPGISQVDVAGIVQSMLPGTQAPDWRIAQGLLGISTQSVRILQPDVPLPYDEIPLERPPFDPMDIDEFPPITKDIIVVVDTQTDRVVYLSPLSIVVDPPTIDAPEV